MDIAAIERVALRLPLQERAKLASLLLESLDELSNAEAEKLWLDEAERRAAEIDAGLVDLVSSEELDRRVGARLK